MMQPSGNHRQQIRSTIENATIGKQLPAAEKSTIDDSAISKQLPAAVKSTIDDAAIGQLPAADMKHNQ
ncbi:MAG: hypothetical protein PHR78_07765 [Eubacteriales bacterium]|jgi:hypothetical protein|nr:hypothetical protein [Eubacteriales bacterium]